MVSDDLLRPTVTNEIAFDQGSSNLIPNFERTMGRCCQGAGFRIGNLRYHYFYLTALSDKKGLKVNHLSGCTA